MMEEMGVCSGMKLIRATSRPAPGSQPCTLFDFFPPDYLLVIG